MSDNEAVIQDEPVEQQDQNEPGAEQVDDFFGEGHGQGTTQDQGDQGYENTGDNQQFGYDQGQNQQFEQPHDQGHDQFGGDQGYYDQGQHHGQPQVQTGGDGYDDFFGGAGGSPAKPQGGSPDRGAQAAYGGGQGMGYGMGGYGESYDPEEEERQERLRRREQERNQKLDEKAREERDKKQDKIAEAARDLAKWHSEREQNIEKRKQINKNNQSIQNDANDQEDYKNPWDKIVGNIATKEGEYPGTKDVTRFRQSLINKKTDVAKGLNNDLGDF